MSYAPALDAYAFDVAVSFASEDREFVGEIVSRLTASNARVFCDSDFSAGIRGEELPGHLDRIYRRKTPHAVIFVSRYYAEKMWTRYERRAVITGAHENSGIHILAVTLDNTALPGLRPEIGCLDARWVGLAGIVEAILGRLGIMRAGRADKVTRVPRTEAESQQLLMTRPTGWEFLHFAARLLRERAAVEGKYRDFVMGYAPPTDEVICIEDAPDFFSRAVRYAMQRTRNLNRVISPAVQEGAFGRPGEDGDAEAIWHMAMRLNSIYEDLIDWTARVRGATLPAEFACLVELLGNVAGHTISEYRKFVDTFVAQNDRLPEQIAMGKPMTPDLTVTFSIQDEMVEAIRAELRRVAEVFGRRSRPDGSRAGPPGTGQPRPSPPPPRVSHVANGNGNGNGNAIQLGRHGIDGLIQDQGWRRIHSAARNSLEGPRCGWSAVRPRGHGFLGVQAPHLDGRGAGREAGKLPKIFWPATHPNGRRPRSTGMKGDPGTGCGRGIRAGRTQTRPCAGRTPASPGRLSPTLSRLGGDRGGSGFRASPRGVRGDGSPRKEETAGPRTGGSRRPVTERIVMPSQDAKRAGLSRRNLLQGAATAGAAGLAVTAMGAAAPALAATGTGTGTDTGSPPAADHGHHADAGPIMVHVRDARSGDIEVFAGTSQTRLRDQDLAARIARAIG